MVSATAITDYIDLVGAYARSFSVDAFVLVGLVVVLFFFGLRYDKGSIIALILSLYVALLAYIHFPFKEQILLFGANDFQILVSNAILFSLFTIIIYTIINRVFYAEFPSRSGRRFTQAFLLALAGTALLIAFSYHVLPITSVYDFGASVDALFAPSSLFFWWLIAPLVVFLFVIRR